MAKKLLLLAVIVVTLIVAVVGIALLYPAMQPQSIQPQSTQPQAQDASEILQSSKSAVENLDSMTADAYFSQYFDIESIKINSRYTMQLELLRSKGMKINFEDYEYECSGEEEQVATEKLMQEEIKESLNNAWILDKNDKLYFYAPFISEENVTEFAPRPSLLRYNDIIITTDTLCLAIPITDPLHLALLFDHAENATYEGIETVNVGNTPVEAYVVSYKFRDPTIKFMDKADLRTWISTADYMPLKTESSATHSYGTTTMKINFEFGFHSYEMNAFIPPENLSLPENLKVIPR
ncbi:hypothetical protein C5S30_04240 [ANME-1 cluster archaeon GoMg4]|nr:hypothetical protein [ANME-1 cluster archaeon GoMg4]